jgi:hypothetical protein
VDARCYHRSSSPSDGEPKERRCDVDSTVRSLDRACACAAAVDAAVATASALIGRDASAVRLQVDAGGHALVSFRSEGRARTVVAWGAVDARPPNRAQPQVAFSLTVGGSIGRNVCGPYRGPPLAWRVAACTATDGTHWAVQAWQRTLPNYGASATGVRAAWELHLSHWSGPLAVLEIATDWSYRRFHHLSGPTSCGKGLHQGRSIPRGTRRRTPTSGRCSRATASARSTDPATACAIVLALWLLALPDDEAFWCALPPR